MRTTRADLANEIAILITERDAARKRVSSLLLELKKLRLDLAHMAADAGGESCAAIALENSRLRAGTVNK